MKYEIRNLGIIHILSLSAVFTIVEIMLHAAFSKYPQWTILALSSIVMTIHFSRKDAKFVKTNVKNYSIALFFDYFFLLLLFISVALFTANWYYFFVMLILTALISCLKFNSNSQSIGLVFLSRIIPSSYFELLSGCRKNYMFLGIIVLYFSALGLCWVRGLPLFLLWFMTTIVCAFFGEYEPLNILRKDVHLNSILFLKTKLKRYVVPIIVIYTPVVLLNTLFHPDLGIINVLFLLLQILSFSCIIFYKYATYYPKAYFNTNSPTLIIVGLCNLIPYLIPVVLFLNFRYYSKAVKNLNDYFQ